MSGWDDLDGGRHDVDRRGHQGWPLTDSEGIVTGRGLDSFREAAEDGRSGGGGGPKTF